MALKKSHPKHSQLIFDKGAKIKQWDKEGLFSEQCSNNWTFTYEKNAFRHILYMLQKNELKIDHRARCKMRNSITPGR